MPVADFTTYLWQIQVRMTTFEITVRFAATVRFDKYNSYDRSEWEKKLKKTAKMCD